MYKLIPSDTVTFVHASFALGDTIFRLHMPVRVDFCTKKIPNTAKDRFSGPIRNVVLLSNVIHY